MKFEHNNGEDGVVIAQEGVEDDDSHIGLTTREKLRHILHSKPIHVRTLLLLMVYTVFTRLLAALDCKPHEIDLKI